MIRPRNIKKKWIERNSNLTASILTFITIVITIFYSSKNFNLANQQYKDLLSQRKSDSIHSSIQQQAAEKLHFRDSLNILKRDSIQLSQWTEQYRINKEQLNAFRKQIELGKLQFNNQKLAYEAQRQLDRPNVVFSEIGLDTFKNSIGISRIVLNNTGRLTTTIKRVIVFVRNIGTDIWTSQNFPDDVELYTSGIVFLDVPLPTSLLLSSITVYYIRVYYTDYNSKVIFKDIYKRVNTDLLPKITLTTIPIEVQTDFNIFLKRHVANLNEMLNENDKLVQIQLLDKRR